MTIRVRLNWGNEQLTIEDLRGRVLADSDDHNEWVDTLLGQLNRVGLYVEQIADGKSDDICVWVVEAQTKPGERMRMRLVHDLLESPPLDAAFKHKFDAWPDTHVWAIDVENIEAFLREHAPAALIPPESPEEPWAIQLLRESGGKEEPVVEGPPRHCESGDDDPWSKQYDATRQGTIALDEDAAMRVMLFLDKIGEARFNPGDGYDQHNYLLPFLALAMQGDLSLNELYERFDREMEASRNA